MTIDHSLENRLRTALAVEAQRAPQTTLTANDVRRIDESHTVAPMRHRRGTRIRWAAVAAAAIAGTVASVVGFTAGGTTPAFASWTRTPQPISGPQTIQVDRVCNGRDPVIVDRRGHSAYAVYTDGKTWTECLQTIPGLTPDKGLPEGWITLGGDVHAIPVHNPSATQPLVLLSAKSPEANQGNRKAVTWVSGRYSAAVARIVIQTSHGSVVPTLRNGVFAAWWPGNDGDTDVVRAYDGAGRLISTIDEWSCGSIDAPFSPRLHATDHAPIGGCTH